MYRVGYNYFCLFNDMILGASGDTEDDSAPKIAEKLPSTPDMSARDAKPMADSMLRDSPLPDSERGNEKVPEDGGSDKLSEEEEGEKLPEGGSEKQLEETPAGKLVSPCRKGFFSLLLI